tara:strand:+ start:36 stop:194 length:159 start_codon:yes stop_codon:yes gene_type:complete
MTNADFDQAFDIDALFDNFGDTFGGIEELSNDFAGKPDLTINKFMLEFNGLL